MSFKRAYSDIVDLGMFVNNSTGALVDITGTDPRVGGWSHRAFVPARLPEGMPELTMPTVLAVGNARAALASLDSTARRLPDPTLLRVPTLRREAHSTSALEGTYAPLAEVLGADVEEPGSPDLREILNFEVMASLGFAWVGDGRPLSTTMLCDLQGVLMRGGPLEEVSGRLRDTQVVVGLRSDVDPGGPAIKRARFVPAPPARSSRRDCPTSSTGCGPTTVRRSTPSSPRPCRTISSRHCTRSATETVASGGSSLFCTSSRWTSWGNRLSPCRRGSRLDVPSTTTHFSVLVREETGTATWRFSHGASRQPRAPRTRRWSSSSGCRTNSRKSSAGPT
ncbi:MAG TPA: hypothetical protein H9759_00580 [Candidatus Dietzia intestinipullorum]|nr:hypothetical protein [Candidatus Dietzia intestinipullorum]